MTVRVQKWGNSLGIRIPKAIATQSDIREGTELNISHEDGLVTLQTSESSHTQGVARAGEAAKSAGGTEDWGKRVGKEAW